MRTWRLKNGLLTLGNSLPVIPKKQHFFAAFHLSRFANEARQVSVYRKDGTTYLANIRDCAQEHFFNEYRIANDQTNGKIERVFSTVETAAAPILDELLLGFQLSVESIMKWSLYLAGLFFRSNKVRTQICQPLATQVLEETLGLDETRNLQAKLWAKGELLTSAEVRDLCSKQTAAMLSQPAYVHFYGMHETIPKLAFSIARKNWVVLNAPEDASFITTDAPVITMQLQDGGLCAPGYGFARERTAILVPLTPKRLFVASPHEVRWKAELSSAEVGYVNTTAAQFGEKVIFSHKPDSSYRDLAINSLNIFRFGRDVFCMPSVLPGAPS